MPASGGLPALLHGLVRIVSENGRDAGAVLDGALALMARHMRMMRGAITLISPRSGEISIQASYGLNAEEKRRGHYLRGEGVTGRVIQSGEPMLVSNVSSEPLFLNRTRARDLRRENLAFLCVPIRLGSQVVGALSVDRLLADEDTLHEEARLLAIIAAILAPAALAGQDRMDEEPQPQLTPPRPFIGNSEIMQAVYEQIAQVAPSQSTVFLQGESGTGKELAARAIHTSSSRSAGPFISLNCAALPESLIESELFGHERGAFTGASAMRKGRFELADGGTLFLDEVGELTPRTQARLLRVLQERSFERLGGMQTRQVDVRVITATNRDLERMVEAGEFRRDLFYRLNVFPIHLPALRERSEDILPLCAHFLRKFGQQAGRSGLRLSLAAMDMLEGYAWPGNIRELQNVMERAVLLLGHETVLQPRHLPAALRGEGAGAGAATHLRVSARASLEEKLEELERACIVEALERQRGHMGRAAVELGLTERVLGLRLKKYGLSYKTFRHSAPDHGAASRA